MMMRMIHDVSTDTDDPPQFVALSDLRLTCQNGAEYSGLSGAEQAQKYPDIRPVEFRQPPATIFAGALGAANAAGWAIAAAVEAAGRIEATATTPILRFKDDVVIRVRAHDSGTRLDVRSASRVGSGDLGTNARRIRNFLMKLNNHLNIYS